jgi:Raf kinase inhibitor-like YbhB/YbcL family protein
VPAVRIQLFTTLVAIALTACGDTGGDTDDTSSTGPTSADDDDSGPTDPSVTMTDPESSSGMTDPTDASSSTVTADGSSTTDPDGSSSSAADESSSSTSEPVAFGLFSDAFEDGGGIPGIHHISGGNQSPPLNWEGVPPGTMSLAIFFLDLDFGPNFPHSAIWDIPADVTELAQDVDHDPMPADVPGAVQCINWTGDEYGYGGPGSPSNLYQFTFYAIDVESIREIDQNSDLDEVLAAFEAHAIASASLTGQSTGPN